MMWGPVRAPSLLKRRQFMVIQPGVDRGRSRLGRLSLYAGYAVGLGLVESRCGIDMR